MPVPPAPFLYPIVDTSLLGGRSVGSLVSALVKGGARLIQLRAKSVSDRVFLSLASEALSEARKGGATLIINDRLDIARMVGADGVHVGQDDLAPKDVRQLLGPDAILGFSTHSREQIEKAVSQPIDYLAVGPVFETSTKANPDATVGPLLLRAAASLTRIPVVAIGGLSLENMAAVFEAGAAGAAMASAVLSVADVESAFRALTAALPR